MKLYILFIINTISNNRIPTDIYNYIEDYNKDSKIDTPDPTGKTPLIKACINKDIIMVRYLLSLNSKKS